MRRRSFEALTETLDSAKHAKGIGIDIKLKQGKIKTKINTQTEI